MAAMRRLVQLLSCCYFFACWGESLRLPHLDHSSTVALANEMMRTHATHRQLSPEFAGRVLITYLEHLDPQKLYLIASDIDDYMKPSSTLLDQVIADYKEDRFTLFESLHDRLVAAIQRRRLFEPEIAAPSSVPPLTTRELKDLTWTSSIEALKTRLAQIRAVQWEVISKLPEEEQAKSLQRLSKRQLKWEEEMCPTDPTERKRLIFAHVLKAIAASLDTHSVYFTPYEAAQFMINIQQRLCGIGAQLRDDLNGFTIVKLVKGGPADQGNLLKVNDRIVAINGEPVIGMDIESAVQLIRGESGSSVTLTVIRQEPVGGEQTLDIPVKRGEVVLKERRFKCSHEPYGAHVIAYCRLYSFYQDADTSSADDLKRELRQLMQHHSVAGVILDLRSNAGGLLSQAVAVAGLFMDHGIVASIKDEQGRLQHLRHLNGPPIWRGPLIILVNAQSASASEIVAQNSKDYGIALIVGDSHTFGKGSYQTCTLSATEPDQINPRGEYKVTRGRYYTVSGQTPQLVGVVPHIVVPGPLSRAEIGEKYAKHPLEGDTISSCFRDDLSDLSFLKRQQVRHQYRLSAQQREHRYTPYLSLLQQHSKERLARHPDYQHLLSSLEQSEERLSPEEQDPCDLQLQETFHIMKELIFLTHSSSPISIKPS